MRKSKVLNVSVVIAIVATAILLTVFIVLFTMRFRYARLENEAAMLQSVHQEKEKLQERLQTIVVENARLKEQLGSSMEKLQWTKTAEHRLREAFEALSSQALKSNAADLQYRHAAMLDEFKKRLDTDWQSQHNLFKRVVDPLSREFHELTVKVQVLEKSQHGDHQDLLGQLTALTRHNRELQDTTNTLSNALKSSSVRGKWGEVQLRRIVEMAGMVDHVDFEEQQNTGGQRPDMLVRLPNNGIIPVDAKVPMQSYLEAQQSNDEESNRLKLSAHARALRGRVMELAKKEYWTQFDLAPDFVVMLVPYESGLSAAFQVEPGLLDEALNNRVLIASPVTLLALLRTVSIGWFQLQLSQDAQAIAIHGRTIVDRFSKFLSHLGDLGSRLNGAVDSYNAAIGSAEQRLLPSLRKLSEMTKGSDEVRQPSSIDSQARRPAYNESSNEKGNKTVMN